MVSLAKTKIILGEFIDSQIVPIITNSFTKWAFKGGAVLALNSLDKVLLPYLPMLTAVGVMDQEMNVYPDKLKLFFESAFAAEPKVEVVLPGCTMKFSKADADTLIALLERENG